MDCTLYAVVCQFEAIMKKKGFIRPNDRFRFDLLADEMDEDLFDAGGGLISRESLRFYFEELGLVLENDHQEVPARYVVEEFKVSFIDDFDNNYLTFLNTLVSELEQGPVTIQLEVYPSYADMLNRNRGMIYSAQGGDNINMLHSPLATGANQNFIECQDSQGLHFGNKGFIYVDRNISANMVSEFITMTVGNNYNVVSPPVAQVFNLTNLS
ncbi:unnamed protein product [Cochlearia groenlandica]